MAKRLPKVVVKSPALHRCIAENTVQIAAIEYSRRFGPGQIVDFEESIGDGVTLGKNIRHAAWKALEGEERKP